MEHLMKDKEQTKLYQTSPELDVFFSRLLDLKKFINAEYESSKLPILLDIYTTLHLLIKEKEE